MRPIARTPINLASAFLLGVTVLLVGHHPAAGQTSSAQLPTIRLNALWGATTWVKTLDPVISTEPYSAYPISMVNADLVKLDGTFRVIPDLATWKVSKGGRVYTFTIRPQARFGDGRHVTADDAAFSLTRALAKSTASPTAVFYLGHIVGAKRLNAGKASRLAGVRVLGTNTLRITLDSPVAYFLEALTYQTGDVLERRVLQGRKANTYLTDTCSANVGAGPFRFVCQNGGTSPSSFYPSGSSPTLTLEPNPFYYGKPARVRVILPLVPTVEVNYREYLSGAIDMTQIPSGNLDGARQRPDFHQWLSSGTEYLEPDKTTPPFDNLHCRLAAAYAIDQSTLNYKVLRGSWVNIYSFVPKGIPGYYAGADTPHYDPNRARAELKLCPGGIKGVKAKYVSVSVDYDNLMAALSAMWAAVGIDITPEKVPGSEYVSIRTQPLSKTNTKLIEDGYGMDYADPQDWVSFVLISGGAYNAGGYSNPQVDQLVHRADLLQNQRTRVGLYIQAQRLALTDADLFMLGQIRGFSLLRPSIRGMVGNLQLISAMYARNFDWSNVRVTGG